MTYSDAIKKRNSFKYSLVRIEPCKLIDTSNSSLFAANVWQHDEFYEQISRVVVNGVTYSKTTNTTPSSNQYYHDKDQGILRVYTTLDIDEIEVLVFFYIFLTDYDSIQYYEEPFLKTGDFVNWLPRIASEIVLSESIENNLEGIFSTSISGLELFNQDSYFNKYANINISFFNKEVKIWHFVDGLDNSKNYSFGITKGINFTSGDRVQIDIRDYSSLFDELCILDDYQNPIYNSDQINTEFEPTFPLRFNIQPSKKENYYKFFFGRDSKWSAFRVTFNVLFGWQYALDPESLEEATCYDYEDPDFFLNRNHVLGLVDAPSMQYSNISCSFESISAPFMRVNVGASDVKKFSIGDYIRFTGVPDTAQRFVVSQVNTTNNTITVVRPDEGPISFTSVSLIFVPKVAAVFLSKGGQNYRLREIDDYTVTETLTAQGNILVSLKLKDNIETDLSIADPYDPETDKIYFKLKPPHNKQKHATVVKKIVEKTGLEFSSTDEALTNSDLSVNALLSVPLEPSAMETFREIFSLFTISSFSYFYLDNEFKVGYKVFKNPTGGLEINSNEIIDGSFAIDYFYEDIPSEFIFKNEFADQSDSGFYIQEQTNGYVKNNNKSKLHNVNRNQLEINHVIDSILPLYEQVVDFRSNPTMVISFQTSVKLFDSKIGDDIVLIRENLPNGLSSINLKIIGIEKSTDRVSVRCTDLNGL